MNYKMWLTRQKPPQRGREGVAKSDDGRLNVNLSTPKGLGGDDGSGTNPKQLFAAGYAACFIGAIDGGFGIAVKLAVSLGDMDKAQAQTLVDKAHLVFPYSNATRGNITVELSVI